ncbi:MAG: transglutaminase domain-containing protein [Candidatus Rokubacteria bacterium]|nr:transglutaminase domain-containing protein [Candidatus Rokubacteria bacterium]
MNTPAGLVGAAVLLWGWQTGLLLFAIPIAVLLEGSRLARWRWELSTADFYRVADLCRLVLVAMGVYQFTTALRPTHAIWGVVQWFPLAVLPLVACQAYTTAVRLDPWSFLLIVRRRAGGDPADAVNLAYPFFALVILAASTANTRGPGFYAGLVLLAAWALWAARPGSVPAPVWLGLFALAAVAGYGGHVGLWSLQKFIEGTLLEFFFADRRETDPFRATTAFGRIGQLKLSERIVLRVAPDGVRPPVLLREASYNFYNAPLWVATDPAFTAVRPEADGLTWQLLRGAVPQEGLVVSSYLRRGKGVLPLPSGAARIERLSVLGVQVNPLGAVKVEEGLGLVTYRVGYGSTGSIDGPPTATDLKLPARDGPLLAAIAAELRLAEESPAQRLRTVTEYFRTRFRYSIFLPGRAPGASPLEEFLLRSRAGHCEYFATATVLLLRAAGIPARYAVGYSVQEWSGLEKRFVVRARHAHSWTLAWVDGAWRDVDTTPPAWSEAEEKAAASIWQPLYDLSAWGFFLFSRWRWGETESGVRYVVWLLVPLIGFLAWRLRFRRQAPAGAAAPGGGRDRGPRPGADSDFYTIEARLGALGLERQPWEPPARWLERLRATRAEGFATDALAPILALHYRYRFDPHGLSPAERERLRAAAAAWLQSVPPSP